MVVVAEEVAEEEEVDLVAEVVAEVDLEVRGSKCCCLEGGVLRKEPKTFLGVMVWGYHRALDENLFSVLCQVGFGRAVVYIYTTAIYLCVCIYIYVVYIINTIPVTLVFAIIFFLGRGGGFRGGRGGGGDHKPQGKKIKFE